MRGFENDVHSTYMMVLCLILIYSRLTLESLANKADSCQEGGPLNYECNMHVSQLGTYWLRHSICRRLLIHTLRPPLYSRDHLPLSTSRQSPDEGGESSPQRQRILKSLGSFTQLVRSVVEQSSLVLHSRPLTEKQTKKLAAN